MRYITTLLFSLILAFTSYGQERKIIARVLDSNSGKPVYNAKVLVDDKGQGVFTNFLGYCELIIPPEAKHLSIYHITYYTTLIEIPATANFSIPIDRSIITIAELKLKDYIYNTDLAFNDSLSITHSGDSTSAALYQGGIEKLHSNLAFLITRDSSFSSDMRINGVLEFGISKDGKVEEVLYKEADPDGSELVVGSLKKIEAWVPAQNYGIAATQYFRLPVLSNQEESEIFEAVDEPATPNGGYMALDEFFKKSLIYPYEARRMGVEGKVYVKFVVEKDGSISGIEVTKGIGVGCDNEAIRLLAIAPAWTPAYNEGKPVRQRIILPIRFDLNEWLDRENKKKR